MNDRLKAVGLTLLMVGSAYVTDYFILKDKGVYEEHCFHVTQNVPVPFYVKATHVGFNRVFISLFYDDTLTGTVRFANSGVMSLREYERLTDKTEVGCGKLPKDDNQ